MAESKIRHENLAIYDNISLSGPFSTEAELMVAIINYINNNKRNSPFFMGTFNYNNTFFTEGVVSNNGLIRMIVFTNNGLGFLVARMLSGDITVHQISTTQLST